MTPLAQFDVSHWRRAASFALGTLARRFRRGREAALRHPGSTKQNLGRLERHRHPVT
jgi:hypothetical protein